MDFQRCKYVTWCALYFVRAVLSWAKSVIIVPGYGLAVARAQQAVAELARNLMSQGVKVRDGNYDKGMDCLSRT